MGTEQEEQIDNTGEIEALKAAGINPDFSQPQEEQEEETEAEETEQDDGSEGYDFGGGKKFRTQKEALAYAQELTRAQELELAQANAYRQAIEENRQYSQAPQTQQAPQRTKEELEAEYYTDPIAATERIVAEAGKQILTRQQAAAEDARIQRAFCDENPDLEHLWDFVALTVQKDPQLYSLTARTKGEKAARDLAAQKVRAALDMAQQIKKPKTELGKQKSVTPPAGQQSVTKKAAAEKTLSMAEQMSELNEKRRK